MSYIADNLSLHFKCVAFLSGVQIGFGELDYLSREGDGFARVVITQSEPITENFTIPIMAVSFQDFYGAGRTLTEHFGDVGIPDPAECKE